MTTHQCVPSNFFDKWDGTSTCNYWDSEKANNEVTFLSQILIWQRTLLRRQRCGWWWQPKFEVIFLLIKWSLIICLIKMSNNSKKNMLQKKDCVYQIGHVAMPEHPSPSPYSFLDKLVPFWDDKDPILPLFLKPLNCFLSFGLLAGDLSTWEGTKEIMEWNQRWRWLA